MTDLFGSILFLSLKQRINMREVLNFQSLRYLLFLQVLMEVRKKHPQQSYYRNRSQVLRLLNQQV